MHMADALLSPAVGASFWAVSGATLAYSGRRVRTALDDHRVPLMGVLGAFVFAAQMINFAIPGTGSSGHLGGGLLLAILLGPHAAFITIASVLVVQAFFFADGGLLALGANVFNLGALPCFFGLPVFRAIAGRAPSAGRMAAAAVAAAVVGLQAGAQGVVLATLLSGRSDLAAVPFSALMAGIHLPIAVIEGLVTSGVVGYVLRARPQLAAQALGGSGGARPARGIAPALLALGGATLVTALVLSLFASTKPDGLEWSLERLAGGRQHEPPARGLRGALSRVQEKTAASPDSGASAPPAQATPAGSATPGAAQGAPLAGLVGALLTLALAAGIGFAASRRARRRCEGLPR